MLATLLTLAINATPCEVRADEASAVTCGELVGQATRLVADGPIGTVQDLVVTGITQAFTTTQRRRLKVPLRGRNVAVDEVTVFDDARARSAMMHLRVLLRREVAEKHTFRVLVCTASGQRSELEGCDAVFSALEALPLAQLRDAAALASAPMAGGPDGGAEPAPTWTGVRLPTPAGCAAPAPGLLECAQARLLWADAPDEEPLARQKILSYRLAAQSGSEAIDRPCLLDGKPLTCTTVATQARGQPLSVTLAVGDVKGRRTSLQCLDLSSTPDAGLPPPCDLVLAWPPGASTK